MAKHHSVRRNKFRPSGNAAEGSERTASMDRPVSRRTFVKHAAAGTLGLSMLTGWPMAAKAGPKEVGTITLDMIMLSYIGAVPGQGGSSAFKPLKGYATIFNLAVPGITLNAAAGAANTGLGFYQQDPSQKVAGALDLMPAPHTVITNTITGGQPQDSAVYGLLGPTLKLKGTPDELGFHLVKPLVEILIPISQLLADPSMEGISQDTAMSISTQYVSNVSDLVAPRYQQQQLFATGEGSLTTIFSSTDFDRGTAQASVTAKITGQTGFTSSSVKDALAVGTNLTITYNSGFDKESGKVLSLEITAGDTPFTTYLDDVFKSVVLIPASD
jgi:hypothetical protein